MPVTRTCRSRIPCVFEVYLEVTTCGGSGRGRDARLKEVRSIYAEIGAMMVCHRARSLRGRAKGTRMMRQFELSDSQEVGS